MHMMRCFAHLVTFQSFTSLLLRCELGTVEEMKQQGLHTLAPSNVTLATLSLPL